MKKLLIIAAIIMAFTVPAYAAEVEATWEHDGINVDGFTMYWKVSTAPDWQFNKTVFDGTARQMILAPEEAFAPGTEYTFAGIAFNSAGNSGESNPVTWTRDGEPYIPPDDVLPTSLYLAPTGINQIIISLP